MTKYSDIYNSDIAYWVILHAFLKSVDFFQNLFFFRKILSGLPLECQTVWIKIRPDILSGLVWVPTVCKCYQTRILVGKESTSHEYLKNETTVEPV